MLYYIDGYSQRDISGILGVPLGTVKRRLHESRELLRKEVVEMVKEAFENNKLAWKFTQDVVNRVSELKRNLTDYLPDKFRELARMSGHKLTKRRNHLLRSLTEVLSIPEEEVSIEKRITIQTADLSEEQKKYLWQTLHELELMDIITTIQSGSIFTPLIQDFNNVKVEVGRYSWPGKEDTHNKLYVRVYRPNPDGGAHSMQMGPIED